MTQYTLRPLPPLPERFLERYEKTKHKTKQKPISRKLLKWCIGGTYKCQSLGIPRNAWIWEYCKGQVFLQEGSRADSHCHSCGSVEGPAFVHGAGNAPEASVLATNHSGVGCGMCIDTSCLAHVVVFTKQRQQAFFSKITNSSNSSRKRGKETKTCKTWGMWLITVLVTLSSLPV